MPKEDYAKTSAYKYTYKHKYIHTKIHTCIRTDRHTRSCTVSALLHTTLYCIALQSMVQKDRRRIEVKGRLGKGKNVDGRDVNI